MGTKLSKTEYFYYKSVNRTENFEINLSNIEKIKNEEIFTFDKEEYEKILKTLILTNDQKSWIDLQENSIKLQLMNIHKSQIKYKIPSKKPSNKNFLQNSTEMNNENLKFFFIKFDEKSFKVSEKYFVLEKFLDWIKFNATNQELKYFFKMEGLKKIIKMLKISFLNFEEEEKNENNAFFQILIVNILDFFSEKDNFFDFFIEKPSKFYYIILCLKKIELQLKVIEIMKSFCFYSKEGLETVFNNLEKFKEKNNLSFTFEFLIKILRQGKDIHQINGVLTLFTAIINSAQSFFLENDPNYSLKNMNFKGLFFALQVNFFLKLK